MHSPEETTPLGICTPPHFPLYKYLFTLLPYTPPNPVGWCPPPFIARPIKLWKRKTTVRLKLRFCIFQWIWNTTCCVDPIHFMLIFKLLQLIQLIQLYTWFITFFTLFLFFKLQSDIRIEVNIIQSYWYDFETS